MQFIRCLIGFVTLAAALAAWTGPARSEETPPAEPATVPPPAGTADTAAAPVTPAEAESWPSEFFKSLKFSGLLETSYTFNTQKSRPATGNENRGRIFDVNSNEFMLNQFELNVEKPVSDDSPVGFKVSPLIGQTAPFTQSFGLFNNDFDGDGTSESDGNFDLVEAYIQGLIPATGTVFKGGKFLTSAGAEVISAAGNDMFSRSYLFGLAIPFTHTGLLATQPLLRRGVDDAELLTASAGIANGWDQVKDVNEAKVILTNLSFYPLDMLALYGNFFYSFSEQSGNNSNSRTLFDLVAAIYPIPDTKDFKFLLNFDWAGEEEAAVAGGYAQWYGFAGIVRWDFTEGWYVAFRGEAFNDPDGARTGGIFADAVGTPADNVRLYELTLTLGWKPVDSLLLRTELRYDKANQDVFFHRTGDAAGNADESHQATIAFDAIFLF
jgi:hypothetical protein